MDAAQVEQAVLLGWYWQNASTCRAHNRVIADWVQQAPQRFIGFAAIHPGQSAADVIDQLQQAHALGLQGVGELHPGVQQFNSSSPGWQALASWCVAHNWPVNLHATEAVGHDHPGNVATPLDDFVRMASASPALKLILAHWGGGLAFYELNPRLRQQLRNVWYDCSASPLLYQPQVFRRVIDIVGPDKVLFGSDFPLRIYPKQQTTPDFHTYLHSIQTDAELSASELDALLYQNWQALLAC